MEFVERARRRRQLLEVASDGRENVGERGVRRGGEGLEVRCRGLIRVVGVGCWVLGELFGKGGMWVGVGVTTGNIATPVFDEQVFFYRQYYI